MALFATDEQRAVIDKVQALMSLLEGHGNVVMDRLGKRHVTGQDRMSAALKARRQSGGAGAQFRKLVGIEMKMRQYEIGEQFITPSRGDGRDRGARRRLAGPRLPAHPPRAGGPRAVAGAGRRRSAGARGSDAGLRPRFRLGAGRDSRGAPVVVACSGGPDSLALLALAAEAGLDAGRRPRRPRRPGRAAPPRRRSWRPFAERLGAGFAAETVAGGAGAELRGPGPGRPLRGARGGPGAARAAPAVLVGHSRDDQAETVLLNLLRGAGVAGLAGHAGPPGAGSVRPLLDVPPGRPGGGLRPPRPRPLDDPMNADPAYRRVWLRREVIPPWRPAPTATSRAVLARPATVARADFDLLDELAADLLAGRWRADPVDAPGTLDGGRCWPRRPTALARRAVRAVARAAPAARGRGRRGAGRRPGRAPGPPSWRAAWTSSGPGGACHRPRTVGWSPARHRAPSGPVDLPGTAVGFGLHLEAGSSGRRPSAWPDGRWTAVLDADVAGERAVLRPPTRASGSSRWGWPGTRPSPRPWPRRASGRRRTTGRGTARCLGRAPDGSALWVLGYRIDDRVRVSPGTRRFLWVTVEAGGPQG